MDYDLGGGAGKIRSANTMSMWINAIETKLGELDGQVFNKCEANVTKINVLHNTLQ
jgi:hypothetical protein